MSIWFTSDLHLGHRNIVKGESQWEDKGECRDFDNIEKHDSLIINNINEVVGQNDILYILGDFCLPGNQTIEHYRNRIICQTIHLVLGNHDTFIRKNKDDSQRLFTSVQDVLQKKIGDFKFFMSHYSHRVWASSHKGAIHLFGHSHNGLDWQEWGKSMDVCVEGNDYRPYHINDIKKHMEKREALFLDHHDKRKR